MLGDPPTGLIRDINYDNGSGKLTFSCRILVVYHSTSMEELHRDLTACKFDGSLKNGQILGRLEITEKENVREIPLRLRFSKHFTSEMIPHMNVEEFVVYYRVSGADSPEEQKQNKEWLAYEPAVVELKGKLVVKTFYGPPNYGEDPDTDTREDEYILLLESPVNVRGEADADGERPSVENIREMELVLSIPHEKLTGKTVDIKGTLFHALTGHHHTDVLMDVRSIELAVSS